jgi:nitroreductase
MDALLAIASRREVREYRPEPLPEELVRRILDAGRIAGSSRNRQPCRFVAVTSRELLDALAQTVSRGSNVLGAPLLVAVAVEGDWDTGFDAGRAGQNMMLAAWAEGIGSCPNTFTDRPRASSLLDLEPAQELVTGLTFGYPARPRRPERRSVDEWFARANRLPLEELVRRL